MNLVIAINGILTRQSRIAWPDMFDAWAARELPGVKVNKKEYLAHALPLWNVLVRNRLMARGIAEELQHFCAQVAKPVRIHFISHSNGTHIALKAVQALARRGLRTETLIVVGSVLDPDIEQNGVEELLTRGQLGRAISYSSWRDAALRFGRWSLGYSELGRTGWLYNNQPTERFLRFTPEQHGPPTPGKCYTRRFDTFGHGTYFETPHREQTFALFRKDMGL